MLIKQLGYNQAYGFVKQCDYAASTQALKSEVLVPSEAALCRPITSGRISRQMQRFQTQVLLLTCYVILDKPHKLLSFYFCSWKMSRNSASSKTDKMECDDPRGKVLQSERQVPCHPFYSPARQSLFTRPVAISVP